MRHTPKKAKVETHPVVAQIFDAAYGVAERAYLRAVEEHAAVMVREQERFDAEMRNPVNNERVGLPAVLPESTITILARTRALDVRGDEQPDRKTFYTRYGVA